MTKQHHRIVVNKARGLWMAVAETVAAQGKAGEATRTSSSARSSCQTATVRPLTFALWAALGLVWPTVSPAQIVANPGAAANLRPTVISAANGVPLVNIQTPSPAGVSRNLYSQFDVKQQGAILNNASANVLTQLGGWIEGNPWLASGSARIILNEVNSSNPSLLQGYVEVAGSRAQVVIANPSGISCDGCGFINANRATLTTGSPIVNGGSLDGYRVQRGSISVSGAGLDARTADYTDIIARAVQVNAGIWAQQLKVTAGAVDVNAAHTSATPIAGTGAAPTVAIDVALLGGMYAGKITLVGTEAGVGVRNAGGLAASAGELIVTADGRLENTGTLTSTGATQIDAQAGIQNSGTVSAQGNTTLHTAGTIDNAAAAKISGSTTRITAYTLNNRGLIDGLATVIEIPSVNNLGSGKIYGDQVAIHTTTLRNEAEGGAAPVIAARSQLDIGAQTIHNREHAVLFSAGDLALGGSLDTNQHATGLVDTLNNASATIEALGNVTISARQVNNTNEHYSTIDVALPALDIVEYEGVGALNRYQEGAPGVGWSYQDRATYLVTPDGEYFDWTAYRYTRTPIQTQVASTDPAKIRAGGNLHLSAESLNNDKSHITAGGAVTGTLVTSSNTEPGGATTNNDIGTATLALRGTDCSRWGCAVWEDYVTNYSPSPYVAHDSVDLPQPVPHGSGTLIDPLSTSSLFSPVPTGHYLMETDPRFTNYRTWLSSDTMLSALGIDPEATQKRMGDGFYEQQLLREQVGQLTGRRFLEGYANDEAQFQALMDSGVTYAQAHQLRPGVSLSAEQIAQLTSDIVWLVEKTVTLQDGSTTKVLAPQLYVKVREGDLQASGALISGDSVHLNVSGDLTNSGTIAGRRVVNLNAENVQNLGRISGTDVGVQARNDLNNLGGSVTASSSLSATAGRDLKVISTTSTQSSEQSSSTRIGRVAGLYVTGANGTLVATAGRDMQLNAAAILNSAPTGSTALAAGRDLNLGVVTESTRQHIVWDAANQRSDATRTDIGTTLQTQGDLRLQAGGDLNAKAANVTSDKGAVLATAGGNVKLTAGQASAQVDESHRHTSKSLFSSKTITTHDTLDQTTALGSTFSGNTTTVLANQDIQVQGSNVVSTQATVLAAQNHITLEAAKNTKVESHLKDEKLSGLFGTGGIGFTVGTRQQSVDQDGTTNTAAASTVGSLEGNISLQAGKNYAQVGSDVLSPQGDISIAAQKVNIEEARDTSQNETETKFKQSGLTLALTSPVISAIQTAQQMSKAAGQTSDSRMKVLAGAAAALAAKNTYDAMPENSNPSSGISLSISIGGSKSQSNTVQTADNAAGSTVAAGGDISIRATGAWQNSDLTVQGSSVQAGNNVTLQADNQINLLAAQSTADQHSTNKSISGSIGFSIGSNTGFTVSASGARGNADGSDVTQANTHVEAGQQLSLQSGGDTTLQGAVAKANQVSAHVGGNLRIESLQDTSKFDGKQKSIGGSVTIGPTPGGSLSASKSKVNSDFASVTEQSGIKAGEGGFQVAVAGNTDLKGGAITSTQAAIDSKANSFASGGVLTTSDIQNHASYSAKSVGINVGSSLSQSGKLAPSGTSAGFGSDSGNASSTTEAAISGIAGNKDARTGDVEAGIHKIFDADKVQNDINAQVQITQTFGREAPKAVAKFAMDQAAALRAQHNEEEAKKWDEGGVYRIAIHTATGALAGGAGGALGAAASARAAPLLNEMKTSIANSLKEAGASEAVAKAAGQLIAGATATGIGAVASGGSTAGAAMGLNIDANNRQLHPDEKKFLRDLARAKAEEIAKGSSGASEKTIQALTERLYTVLADETTALTDAKANKQNSLYRQQLEQTKRPGLEGNFGADNQLALMDWARGEALAMQQQHAGQTVQLNGKDLIADGSKVQMFQSSAEQYKDSQLFNTVQREVALKQFAGNADREAAVSMAQDAYREGTAAKVDNHQQQTLERLRATNGAVAIDTTDIDLATLGVGGLAKRGFTSAAEAVGGLMGRKAGQTEAEVVAGVVAKNTAADSIPVANAGLPKAAAQAEGTVVGTDVGLNSGGNIERVISADAGSVSRVNPTGSTQNCTNCVAIVDNLLTTGNSASALPRATPVPFEQLGSMYGTQFGGWTTQQGIEAGLLARGEGARAVIYGTDGATGHVWNAVVQNRKVNYIDGQIGGSGLGNFKIFTNFQFGVLP